LTWSRAAGRSKREITSVANFMFVANFYSQNAQCADTKWVWVCVWVSMNVWVSVLTLTWPRCVCTLLYSFIYSFASAAIHLTANVF